jgi:hypothetical protein
MLVPGSAAGPGRPVSPVAGARLWGDDPFREARRHLA